MTGRTIIRERIVDAGGVPVAERRTAAGGWDRPTGVGALTGGRDGRERWAMTTAGRCGCDACAALLAACGEELFPLYAKKLLVRGWAGALSPVETAYRLAHRPDSRARSARRKGLAPGRAAGRSLSAGSGLHGHPGREAA